ncbi:MAG: alpha/beta hydrolase, partial [Verrucomicrobiae bacterium]|nr:alpha/beta hydrolase [Verrucomicrobiae bacterium]
DVNLEKLDAVFPASAVQTHVVHPRHVREGVGVPLVGWVKTSPVGIQREKYLLPNGYPYNITASIDFAGGGQPVWRFSKCWNQGDLEIGSARHTLACDWTAPNEFFWQMCELDDLRFMNVFLPDRFTEETGLYFVQPYDPDRIPLVLVHGLVSSPDAFKELINDLVPEPWFRENYQIWLYSYPTGNPWSFSARNFRDSMNEACRYARSKGPDDKLNRMVLAAHSMGGLVTRSSVTEPGQVFYDQWFDKPVDQLRVDDHTRQVIKEALLYQPLEEPERVVFMAVPHKGSPLATFRPAMWLSKLIRLPKSLTVEFFDEAVTQMKGVVKGESELENPPTSINTLSPSNRDTVALNQLALPEDIHFHSIIGDRGKGDTPDSSDGVVPYWSSHVEPVESELIVPSDHSVPNCPEAAEELKRILKLHLESGR